MNILTEFEKQKQTLQGTTRKQNKNMIALREKEEKN